MGRGLEWLWETLGPVPFVGGLLLLVTLLWFFSSGRSDKAGKNLQTQAPQAPNDDRYFLTLLNWLEQHKNPDVSQTQAKLHQQLARLKLLEIELRPENRNSYGIGYFNSQMEGGAYSDILIADLHDIGLRDFAAVIQAEMEHEGAVRSAVQAILEADPDAEDPYDDPRVPVFNFDATAEVERLGGHAALVAALNAHLAVRSLGPRQTDLFACASGLRRNANLKSDWISNV